MKKNLYWLLSLIIALSMILSACGPQATEAVEVVVEPTEAEVVEPTAEPVAEPTAEPTPEPLDYVALFTAAMADINPDKGYLNVKPATLAEELAGTAPFVLDVREVSEIEAAGYIEGAVHIPVRDLMKNLDKLPGLDEPIVVTCASGHRGGFVLVALKMMGYTNVRNLSGGMGGWIKAELPVVTGVPAAPAAISTAIIENQQLWTDLDNWFSNIPEGFYSIKADKLNENLAGGATPVFIDVRSAGEWTADGYLAGAINLPIDTFMASLDQLPADKAAPVVVYCASGFRGAAAAMAMQFLGYTDVVNLAGGLGAWKTAQFPVEGWVNWPAVWTEFTASLPADQGFYSISAANLNTALAENPPFLVDLRETAEVEASGYIEGAIHIPVRDLLKNLDKLPALDQPIVVYCGSGHRGGFAMAALRLLGYSNVLNLGGGMGAWLKAELATVTGLPAEAVAGTAPVVDATRLANLDAWFAALPEGFNTVKPADLNTEIAGGTAPIIVDLRPAEDYAAGHIEGAINLNINELLTKLDQLPDKGANIVLTCASGHRGGIALIALNMLGYTAVRNLNGGMNGWVAAELPTVQ